MPQITSLIPGLFHATAPVFPLQCTHSPTLQTEPQQTGALRHSQPCRKHLQRVVHARMTSPTMFLEELSSQETGKEALLKDLRAWQNNLSAFLSPLILTKWYSAYIF